VELGEKAGLIAKPAVRTLCFIDETSGRFPSRLRLMSRSIPRIKDEVPSPAVIAPDPNVFTNVV
jgi:hypothetical protein